MFMSYQVNEIFYSVQGEGVRLGTANVFIRLSGCNLQCSADGPEGFDCDTEFASGRKMSAEDIIAASKRLGNGCDWVVLTGGEPALQVDEPLIAALHAAGYQCAIETNGTKELPEGLDWICVSPKTAEHTIRVKDCDEVKYVRHAGQGIPRPETLAKYYLLSPAFDGLRLAPENLNWCITLVKENPQWRLSAQLHKHWSVR